MRNALLVAAIVFTTACNAESPPPTAAGAPTVVGTWALRTYNGGPLPYTGSRNANGSIDRVDAGSISFDATKSYVLDIRIVNTLGTTVNQQNFAEVGSYSGTIETGLVLRPHDLSGGASGENFASVPVTISGTTLSFSQLGKVLTFVKQ